MIINGGNGGNRPLLERHRLLLRVAAWTTVCSGAIVVLCLAAFLYIANTSAGQRYLLGLVQQKAAETLGVSVQMQSFKPHLSSLSLDIYGVRIAGAGPRPDPPILQADHINVGLRIVSMLRAEWFFDRIQIDHPVLWVTVDSNGRSNLPTIRSSDSSRSDIFDLGIRRLQIEHGEMYYNSRPSAITADLHDLGFRSTFSTLLTQYSGTLSYSNGRLSLGSFRPLTHNLVAEFDATRTLFTLKRGFLTAGASQATLSATVKNYNDPEIEARYQITVDGRQAAQILNESALPTGSFNASGIAHYQSLPNKSLIDSLSINGDVASASLLVNTSAAHVRASNLAAHYSLANANAELHDLKLDAFGGTISANGSMRQIGGSSRSSFQIRLQNASLAQLRLALSSSAPTSKVSLDGNVNATAKTDWGNTLESLVASLDLNFDGKAFRPAERNTNGNSHGDSSSEAVGIPASAAFPVQGDIHAIYSNADRSLRLNNSFVKSMQSNVTLNGTVSRQSNLAINFQTNDLSELTAIANLIRTPQPNEVQLDITGRASFQGVAHGSTDSPDLTGQLTAGNLGYNGTQWKSLRTNVAFSRTRVSLKDFRLESAKQGQVTANVDVGLADGSPSNRSPIELELNASNLSVETIASLSNHPLPLTGTLSATARLKGTVASPTGNASIALTGAQLSGEPISRVKADLSASGGQIQVTGSAELAAGGLQARVTADPLARTYKAQFRSTGIDLAKLKATEIRNIDARGVVQFEAQGEGSFDNPALAANLKIPNLTVSGQNFSQVNVQVNVAEHVAKAEFSSVFATAPLHGNAQVNLTGDRLADVSLDTPDIPLHPIFAILAPDEETEISGDAEFHATLHGPLKDMRRIEAHLKIPVLKLAYSDAIQLAASPIQADLQNGTVTVHPVTIRGTDTELNLEGSFPAGAAAQASLKAQGTVNLQVVQLFDPDLRASGQLKVNIDSRGALGGNLVAGEVDIVGANLFTNTSPVGLSNARATLKLTGDRLEISEFDGTVGGGKFSAQGAVSYRPKIQFDLGMTTTGAKILYPQGVRETADANLRLTGTMQHSTLSGSVNLADLSFTPAFDLTDFINQISGEAETPPTQGFADNLDLNIALNSSSSVNLVSRTLSVGGTANLQVRGTAAEPVLLGRANLSSGEAVLNGNRFVLTGGTIQFTDPVMTRPVLNVSLTTTIQEYKIDLRFQGPTDQLRTQYTSDPSLPPADIINLLAFGKTIEASAANNPGLNQQAEGLVASQISSQVTSRVSKAAGISQLSISPVLAGGTAAGPPGANVTIQQRVTGRLFITFSTNVATTQGQTIQGQYQISPRVAVSATRDPNGGFAFDTIIKKSW